MNTQKHGPRISVIIAAYNAAPFIDRALRSVLQQDEVSVEVIVVDDASTDRTREILRSYADGRRIHLVELPHNVGAAAARQAGMFEAQAELIATLDADDELLPGALSALSTVLLASPDVGLTFAGIDFVDDSGSVTASYEPPDELTFHDLLSHRLVPAQTMLMRRDVLVAAGGFDSGLRVAEDWDLCLRIAQRARLVSAGGIRAVAHLHDSNTSRDQAGILDASLLVLNRFQGVHGALCLACHRARFRTRFEYGRPALLESVRRAVEHRDGKTLLRLCETVRVFPDVLLLGGLAAGRRRLARRSRPLRPTPSRGARRNP